MLRGPHSRCSGKCKVKGVVANNSGVCHTNLNCTSTIVSVREAKVRNNFITKNSFSRHLCKQPNSLTAVQGACGFVFYVITEKRISKCECFSVLNRFVSVSYNAENFSISTSCICYIIRNNNLVFKIHRLRNYIPIKTCKMKRICTCRSIGYNRSKSVPGGFSYTKHTFY